MDNINSVIAGDYLGSLITPFREKLYIAIDVKTNNFIELNKDTVESYKIFDQDQRKSATSAMGRALVGGAMLGAVGLFAGLSAKNKNAYTVEILFKDGKKSLLLLNDKTYMVLVKALY